MMALVLGTGAGREIMRATGQGVPWCVVMGVVTRAAAEGVLGVGTG